MTATVAGAPNNVEGATTFTHSFLESDHVIAELVGEKKVTKHDINVILSAIPVPKSKTKQKGVKAPLCVETKKTLMNEYTELAAIMSGIAPLECLNGWPYMPSANHRISDKLILEHLMMQADHKWWSNVTASYGTI